MSKAKLKRLIHNTDLNNLISNLRGEIGEIIFSFQLMNYYGMCAANLQTNNIEHNIRNTQLNLYYLLKDRFKNEIISRLSELSEQRIGQLTFYFVKEKINRFDKHVKRFRRFVTYHKLDKVRNKLISHKELPEKWEGHRKLYMHISDETINRGVKRAVRLMKKIDRDYLGPRAPYLWKASKNKLLKDGWKFMPKNHYMLLPYMRLSEKEYMEIIKLEENEQKYYRKT